LGETRLQRDARWRAVEIQRSVGQEVRRLREDAGLTRAAVARAAGIDPTYLTLIERGDRDASCRVLASIGGALGADLSVRLFSNSGPVIHDRTQAPMGEALLAVTHPRWGRWPEVVVRAPVHGVIDLVLHDPEAGPMVAGEIQGQVRRLEQQVRWHREKEGSLPSSDLWPMARLAAGTPPATSRLLVLRNTRDLRDLASAYEATLRAAYPARSCDAVVALTGTAPWPGAAIVWMRVEGSRAELLDGPPRRVRLGS